MHDALLQNFSGNALECGCDEAGRGCLAGPVIAAAVILPVDFKCDLINDSKKLTEDKRNKLRLIIEENAIAWAVAEASQTEIDEINILNASILAMHRAVDKLSVKPEFLIIDGNRFKPYPSIAHQTIIKGDAKFLSIAAASILAKTHRDEMLNAMDIEFPVYQWKKNKAYPTIAHRKAIIEHGTCKYHRLSFDLLGDKKKK